MSYLGSWKIDDLLTFTVNTQVFATGVATDADSVPTYRVYEDETGTPILTGSMALLDSANTAGFYSEQITLSAANGFEKGKAYSIYITATVSSVAGATNRNFQMEAEVDANRINWANVDNPTTALNLSATNIDVDQIIASVSGAVGSVTGAVGSVTGAVGSVTGNVGGNVTGNVTGNLGGTLSAAAVAQILTTALTEAYAADGAAPTLSQLLFGIQSFLQEREVSGVTLTTKKINGSTTAMTFTLNSATAPTSITRAT